MVVGFTGTRLGLTDSQKARLVELIRTFNPDIVRHGDCVGADAEFHDLMYNNRPACTTISHPPLNEKYRANCEVDEMWKAKEYLERNKDIVDNCDVLFACPESKEFQLRSGTWWTINYARSAGRVLLIVYPDGSMEK